MQPVKRKVYFQSVAAYQYGFMPPNRTTNGLRDQLNIMDINCEWVCYVIFFYITLYETFATVMKCLTEAEAEAVYKK